ncbi:MAG: dUTP diphosphatase [Clostridia bacterium]|nr:dUTP diphosphatase [Clostridia bacterium]
MERIKVGVKKVREGATLPAYGSTYAAGADLYACIEEETVIEAGKCLLVPTGIAIELPLGTVGLIYARSGLASKRGLAPANKVGVIDCDYRGEVMVALFNHSDSPQSIKPRERIAQLVIAPYYTADFDLQDELSNTVRGQGGFGSTGAL